jgi:UDP-sugar transporter A1/2/3
LVFLYFTLFLDRNIQLSAWSILCGTVFTWFFDSSRDLVHAHGFLYAFSTVTWLCVFLGAAGGLLVAIVVRWTDNIIKGFAVSASIILTSFVSFFIFQSSLSFLFSVGVGVVLISVFNYNEEEKEELLSPSTSFSLSHRGSSSCCSSSSIQFSPLRVAPPESPHHAAFSSEGEHDPLVMRMTMRRLSNLILILLKFHPLSKGADRRFSFFFFQ